MIDETDDDDWSNMDDNAEEEDVSEICVILREYDNAEEEDVSEICVILREGLDDNSDIWEDGWND